METLARRLKIQARSSGVIVDRQLKMISRLEIANLMGSDSGDAKAGTVAGVGEASFWPAIVCGSGTCVPGQKSWVSSAGQYRPIRGESLERERENVKESFT